MLQFFIDGSDRTSDVRADSLRITNQYGQRSDNASFSIIGGAKPVEYQDLQIYASAEVASVASAVVTLKDSYQKDVGRFYIGQTIFVRIGETDVVKRTVVAYNEATREVTLSSALGSLTAGDKIGYLLFGGTVTLSDDSNVGTISVLEWEVTGVGYMKIFDKKLVSDAWQDVDARYIINDFVWRSVNYSKTIDSLSYANATAIRAVWIEANDGGNPNIDSADFMEGNSSGVFAWTYSSGTALWEAALSPAINLSALLGVSSGTPTDGIIALAIESSDISKITTLYLRIGSSSTNYAKVPLTVVDMGDWQFLYANFTDPGVTITGTPDWTATDYAAIELTETASGTMKLNGFRVLQSGSFKLVNVQASTQFSELRSPGLKPSALMDLLANTWQFSWNIDYEKGIHYTTREAESAPWGIDGSTGDNFDDLSTSIDASQLGNRVAVKGGEMTSANRYAQVFQGDNTVRTWILKSKFSDLTILIDDNSSTFAAQAGTNTTTVVRASHGLATGDHVVNRTRSNAVRVVTVTDPDTFEVETVTGQTSGDTFSKFSVAKTAGTEGLTDETTVDYLGNSNEKSVRASSQTETLPTSTFIRFSYLERVQIQVQYTDLASANAMKALGFGDGIFDLDSIVDSNVTDAGTALAMARAKVSNYSNAIITGRFKTDKEGLSAGQLIHIVDSVRGIDDYFIIQRVQMVQQGGEFKDYFRIAVDFGTTLFGWIEFMQKILATKNSIAVNPDELVSTFITANEQVGCGDVNSVTKGIITWKWETSTGQPTTTRWGRFEWK